MSTPEDGPPSRRCSHGWLTNAPEGAPCKHPGDDEFKEMCRRKVEEEERRAAQKQLPPEVKRMISKAVSGYYSGALSMSQMMWEIDIAMGRKTLGQIRAYRRRQDELESKVKEERHGGGGSGPFAASGRTRKVGSHRDRTGHN